MCAFKVVRQIYVHVKGGDGVLLTAVTLPHSDWMANVFDADLIDGDAAGVGTVLHIRDVNDVRICCRD
jgi:hypothetical protein